MQETDKKRCARAQLIEESLADMYPEESDEE